MVANAKIQRKFSLHSLTIVYVILTLNQSLQMMIMMNRKGHQKDEKDDLVFSLLNKPLICLFSMVINNSLWSLCEDQIGEVRGRIHHLLAVVILNVSSPLGLYSKKYKSSSVIVVTAGSLILLQLYHLTLPFLASGPKTTIIILQALGVSY